MKNLPRAFVSFIKDTFSSPFKSSLLAVCAGLFLYMGYINPAVNSEPVSAPASVVTVSAERVVTLYHAHTCQYCREALDFIDDTLSKEFPDVQFKEYELSSPEFGADERKKLGEIAEEYGFEAIPVFYIDGKKPIVGFGSKTPDEYRELIKESFYNSASGEVSETENTTEMTEDAKRFVNVPFMGEIDVMQYSVPFLAVVLGLLDGFNPCAMWVLVFMISIIMEMQDRRKMWLIVGSFLLASGVLYFAVMAGWINLFLLFGYMRNLTILIGTVALYSAGLSLKAFYDGHIVCEADNFEERGKISRRIQELAQSPVSIATVAGVIGLAFVVNSIEFLCSAALPAIFTNVLAVSVQSVSMHYFYIFIYVLFFMIDDIIIFSLAALAVDKFVGDRYVKWCKLVGGIILLGLGIAMVFFPDVLK